jgi:hypothetical protein
MSKTSQTSFVVLLVLLFLSGENALAKMVMFSEVKGQVLHSGNPVAGAVVKREFNWGWTDETSSEQVKTNSEGKFDFPEVTRSSFWGSFLPHEISIQQSILIIAEGKTFDAWFLNKRNYDVNGEIGKPISITCRLEAEKKRSGEVYGICDIDK